VHGELAWRAAASSVADPGAAGTWLENIVFDEMRIKKLRNDSIRQPNVGWNDSALEIKKAAKHSVPEN
jgi:hypothetical protein